ncbi:MAG: DUF4143 domain-containing protein, partial [Deltaproteobacteria bacterium]|nr:DUF4143 domain-containing protein [Deltaproteobacteria bacterium]
LQGRYHYYRLHPFSLAELLSVFPKVQPGEELVFLDSVPDSNFKNLLQYGGFPDPFLEQSEKFLRRWHNERLDRFFKEDVRDLTQIHDLGNLTLLADLLPEKVSSILSINSLAQDLQMNFRTVANWIEVFERFYYCFRLAPFQSRRIASVRKEKKLYLWDWSELKGVGPKVENMLASHLLKFCHYLHDEGGWKVSLHYLRDETGREIDFLVCYENKPWFAVESKSEGQAISKALFHFRDALKIPFCYQVSLEGSKDYLKDGIRVLPLAKFLTGLV